MCAALGLTSVLACSLPLALPGMAAQILQPLSRQPTGRQAPTPATPATSPQAARLQADLVLSQQAQEQVLRELAAVQAELASLRKQAAGSSQAGDQASKRAQTLETQLVVAQQRVAIAENEAALHEGELREFKKRVQVRAWRARDGVGWSGMARGLVGWGDACMGFMRSCAAFELDAGCRRNGPAPAAPAAAPTCLHVSSTQDCSTSSLQLIQVWLPPSLQAVVDGQADAKEVTARFVSQQEEAARLVARLAEAERKLVSGLATGARCDTTAVAWLLHYASACSLLMRCLLLGALCWPCSASAALVQEPHHGWQHHIPEHHIQAHRHTGAPPTPASATNTPPA